MEIEDKSGLDCSRFDAIKAETGYYVINERVEESESK